MQSAERQQDGRLGRGRRQLEDISRVRGPDLVRDETEEGEKQGTRRSSEGKGNVEEVTLDKAAL